MAIGDLTGSDSDCDKVTGGRMCFDSQDVARCGYADMLHDDARNRKYMTAIRATVSSFQGANITSLRVVDIGTGTGLLSMMAVQTARALGIPITVTAFECFPAMAQCARQVIRENGYESDITVVQMKSDSHPGFKEEERADILITELFDTELIGEGALHSYRHAIENFMKPAFVAVPSKGRVWIQVVESEELARFNQLTLPGISHPASVEDCPGAGSLHDLQLSQLEPGKDFKEVTKPLVAFEFDFTSIHSLKLRDRTGVHLNLHNSTLPFKVRNLVLLFWWDLTMSDFDDTILSMAPYYSSDHKEWREHWIQAIYYPSPITSSDPLVDHSIVQGRSLSLTACHDDFSFWFTWDQTDSSPSRCSCGFHIHFSRSRLRQLNDIKRLQPLLDAIECRNPSRVLFIGHFSFLPLILSQRSRCQVICLENGPLYQCYCETNCISNLEIIPSTANLPQVDLVVAEPYFPSNDLPCDSLDFWYQCLEISSKLSDDQIIPNRTKLKCLLVQFDDLWKIRSQVVNTLGFNLDHFDKLILEAANESDDDFESQPLWEYPGKAVTEQVTVFDWTWSQFKKFDQLKCIKSDPIQLEDVNRETMLVFWTEFFVHDRLISSNGPREPVHTGQYIQWDRTTKQGVGFISGMVRPSSQTESIGSSLTIRLGYELNQRKLKLIQCN